MPGKPLTLQQLNRATLARQLLLTRDGRSVVRAIEQLAGMQAQLPRPPYVGLWSRLTGFRRETLTKLVNGRKVVRATMMRGTLHLMSAKDYVALRPVLQPMLTRGMTSVLRARGKGLDLKALAALGRDFFDEPRNFQQLRVQLAKRPGADERAMAYAVRTHVPLVQVPADAPWAYPSTAEFIAADKWLGTPIETTTRPRELVRRYLAAFGPATPADAQAWSGMQALGKVFDELRPMLRTFVDERGRELFDLPKAPRPAAAAKAPVRFLPDYDNLVLAHDDRRRIVADAHRPKICTKNLRILPTVLVDGFVAGTWSIESTKKSATLVVTPFERFASKTRAELAAEGEALLRFTEPDVTSFKVRVAR